MATPLALQIRDLLVTGEGGRPVLAVESLDLVAGAALGIEGPSGAGKSTLILALAGLVPRMTGRIAWDGSDLVALRPAARAAFRTRHLGLVFQDARLFGELSSTANAAVAALFMPRRDRAAIEGRAAAALDALGVPRRRASLLSGGERQRTALARALAADPGILLADEPTAALDAVAAGHVADALSGETGRTRVVASHDPRLLARMDRVIRLEAGALARVA